MLLRLWLLLSLCVILISCVSCVSSCMDDSGRAVDWWAIIKTNKDTEYAYIDSNIRTTIQLSPKKLDDKNSALGSTLSQVYSKPSGQGYIMYNDETPAGKTTSNFAHAKGVLAFSSTGGFWLIHSMPGFPAANKFGIDDSQKIYGQSLLCTSLTAAGIDKVGLQLQTANPQIYAKQAVDGMKSWAPNLDALLNDGKINTRTAASNILPLTTRGGAQFISFVKNAKWGKELYHDLVAPYFKQDLWVECWMRPYEPSNRRGSYKIVNIKTVCVPGTQDCWEQKQDHSKWAISAASAGGNVVCIGDINKQTSQKTRGGGTMCIQNSALYKAFAAMVTVTDDGPVKQAATPRARLTESAAPSSRSSPAPAADNKPGFMERIGSHLSNLFGNEAELDEMQLDSATVPSPPAVQHHYRGEPVNIKVSVDVTV